MKFGRVSATPYCNYYLLCILLLDVFCSPICNLIEYKLLFPVAILCYVLTTRSYVSYEFHEVLLLIKLSIVSLTMFTLKCIADSISYYFV